MIVKIRHEGSHFEDEVRSGGVILAVVYLKGPMFLD